MIQKGTLVPELWPTFSGIESPQPSEKKGTQLLTESAALVVVP
jgi:hypothetical protein